MYTPPVQFGMVNISGTQTLGTCSICGGPVTVPIVFHSIVPPVPRCESCGAHAAPKTWPVVPMVPAGTPMAPVGDFTITWQRTDDPH
jgi:hypothetical protein